MVEKDLSKPDPAVLERIIKADDGALKQYAENAKRHLPQTQWLLDAVSKIQIERGGTPSVNPHSVRSVVIEYARQGKTCTYGDIAKRFNVSWPQIRHTLPKHLGAICEIEHGNDRPLLSCLVVDKTTGKCGDGFFKMAGTLNIPVGDRDKFLNEEQNRVFDYWKDR